MRVKCNECGYDAELDATVKMTDLKGTLFEDKMDVISDLELQELAAEYPNDVLDEEARFLLERKCPICGSRNVDYEE